MATLRVRQGNVLVFGDHSPMFATTFSQAVPAAQRVDWRVCIALMVYRSGTSSGFRWV